MFNVSEQNVKLQQSPQDTVNTSCSGQQRCKFESDYENEDSLLISDLIEHFSVAISSLHRQCLSSIPSTMIQLGFLGDASPVH
mmetsp:Transcript_56977/g.101120  ORF Transcript_56977/g.101120 Transcript_56977/m.101120 type:complete len:83 (-) Transcript_56977:346-594(-)